MVNPDGVIHGMSRTNMAGLDLNRHWGDNIFKVKFIISRN
jgi:murein tripeptide amidase MpaA